MSMTPSGCFPNELLEEIIDYACLDRPGLAFLLRLSSKRFFRASKYAFSQVTADITYSSAAWGTAGLDSRPEQQPNRGDPLWEPTPCTHSPEAVLFFFSVESPHLAAFVKQLTIRGHGPRHRRKGAQGNDVVPKFGTFIDLFSSLTVLTLYNMDLGDLEQPSSHSALSKVVLRDTVVQPPERLFRPLLQLGRVEELCLEHSAVLAAKNPKDRTSFTVPTVRRLCLGTNLEGSEVHMLKGYLFQNLDFLEITAPLHAFEEHSLLSEQRIELLCRLVPSLSSFSLILCKWHNFC